MTHEIITLHHNAIDRTGQRFGRLVAIKPIGSTKAGLRWLCACDCGNESEVIACHLQSGHTQSCGCFDIEKKRSRGIHWMVHVPEYSVWKGMHKRCKSRIGSVYKDYGGRGIVVCVKWNSFLAFLSDMGKRPTPDHSIDRIDNDGDYTPENCRWATPFEQAQNKRNNHMIDYNGERKCLSEWAEEYGLKSSTLRARIKIWGWDIEKALTTPARALK